MPPFRELGGSDSDPNILIASSQPDPQNSGSALKSVQTFGLPGSS
jgi:hypothetical protein